MPPQKNKGWETADMVISVVRALVAEHEEGGVIPVAEVERILDLASKGPSAFDKIYAEAERTGAVGRDSGRSKRMSLRESPLLRLLVLPMEPLFESVPAMYERRFVPGYLSAMRRLLGDAAWSELDAASRSAVLALIAARGGPVELEALYRDVGILAVRKRAMAAVKSALSTPRGRLVWDKDAGRAAQDGALPTKAQIDAAREAIFAAAADFGV